MKKILLINSSKRKKSTFFLLRQIMEYLDDYDLEMIHLGDYKISFCRGCEQCILVGDCPLADDCSIILDKIKSADALIIGTPVYLRQITGLLKVFIDRTCSWYHRSPLIGKPILFATSTASSGTKETLRYLKDLSLQWGTLYCGSISRNVINIEKKHIEKKELERFLKYVEIKSLDGYKPGLGELMEFNTKKVLASKIIQKDREYWSDSGYFNSPFFYKCRINVFNRFIAYLFYKILDHYIPDRIN
ncbi:MAG: NAD(P)H-dependent oxidoreductase [Spirochaetaceae bacterium]|nr:NAD(P)H-dependent oxidoreductase [Spirochaetaceae bacterium]